MVLYNIKWCGLSFVYKARETNLCVIIDYGLYEFMKRFLHFDIHIYLHFFQPLLGGSQGFHSLNFFTGTSLSNYGVNFYKTFTAEVSSCNTIGLIWLSKNKKVMAVYRQKMIIDHKSYCSIFICTIFFLPLLIGCTVAMFCMYYCLNKVGRLYEKRKARVVTSHCTNKSVCDAVLIFIHY